MLAHLTASILQLVISSVVKGMSGRGVRKSEKAGIFSFALSFKQYRDYQLFQLQPRFNGNFSRNNLPKIKNGVYTINLDDKKVKKYIVFH